MHVHLLPLSLLALVLPLTRAQNDDILCPDASLAEYLIALIDVCFANGLTTFENLIVHLSETDTGYAYLNDLYMSGQRATLFVPTDQAWGEVGIWPPFDGLTEDWATELLELHTLQGEWTPSTLSEGHNVAATYLSLANVYNASANTSAAYQAAVMSQGSGGSDGLVVDGWWGNATSWSGPLDSGWTGQALMNLVVLPIDQVLSFPPAPSEALTSSGLSNMSSALDVVGKKDELDQLTSGGFTIFVPVDEAWGDDERALMAESSSAWGLVGSHYTTSYSLFSPMWAGGFDLAVEDGLKLSLKSGEAGSTVSLGEVEADIVRSDITLRNGVMHIIDKVLTPTSDELATINAPSDGKGSGSGSGDSGSDNSDGGKGGSGSGSGDGKEALDDPQAPKPPSDSPKPGTGTGTGSDSDSGSGPGSRPDSSDSPSSGAGKAVAQLILVGVAVVGAAAWVV